MKKTLFTVLSLFIGGSTFAQNIVFDIDSPQKTSIPETLYGLFFEDINFGADGGLYAEMVKNRSFEFPQNFMGWKTFGKVILKDDGPFERNPHYVRLSPTGHKWKHTGIENEGFFGIGIKKGASYRFSVWARLPEKTGSAKLGIEIGNSDSENWGQMINRAELDIDSQEWKKYEITFTANSTSDNAYLRIFLESNETIDIEHVSMFPTDTWNGHTNGLRKDIVQAFAELKPGVFRFPGGCIVEGTEKGTHYDWKKSVGPVENRPLNENRWHFTFKHRFYPDYYQSYGLGFYEYFLLSEEIGAEPLPVVNCGLICQYMSSSIDDHVPTDSLDKYIQDALDLIEFANGPADSEWGKVRASMGHPKPFNLKYIGIGNEQWGKEYIERLSPFVNEIRRHYPDIKIIGSSGPQPEGKEFDYLWKEMKNIKVDLVDEHFYKDEKWFLSQGQRYDKYNRKGPKVFAGEYACHIKGSGRNQFFAALCEAAFLTGVERNADIVEMATYAPLLAHKKGWQWRPDMIWFDNMSICKTTNYYVQKLFSNNKGTHLVSLTMDKKPVAGLESQNGLFASAVWDKNNNAYIIKIVNTENTDQSIDLKFKRLRNKSLQASGVLWTMTSQNLNEENTFENPEKIVPVKGDIKTEDNTVNIKCQPYSINVCIIPISNK